MSDLARRWIDAIQNSLLGDLAVRLVPILVLYESVSGMERKPLPSHVLALWSCMVVFTLLAWVLGFMAIHAKPKDGRAALERIQDAPSNGFEVWSKSPTGGLNPPRLTKVIVMALGEPLPREAVWLGRLGSALLLIAYALLVLCYFDRPMSAAVNPALAEPGGRAALFWFISALMAAIGLRGWGVDCRKQLEADARIARPTRGLLQGS